MISVLLTLRARVKCRMFEPRKYFVSWPVGVYNLRVGQYFVRGVLGIIDLFRPVCFLVKDPLRILLFLKQL